MEKIIIAIILGLVSPNVPVVRSDIQAETARVKYHASNQARERVARQLERREQKAEAAAVVAAAPVEVATVEATGGVALCGSACIACESGWNPQIFSSTGKYWGLYQFDYGTWVAHGGAPEEFGNAPASTQHRIAANIAYDAWPNC